MNFGSDHRSANQVAAAVGLADEQNRRGRAPARGGGFNPGRRRPLFISPSDGLRRAGVDLDGIAGVLAICQLPRVRSFPAPHAGCGAMAVPLMRPSRSLYTRPVQPGSGIHSACRAARAHSCEHDDVVGVTRDHRTPLALSSPVVILERERAAVQRGLAPPAVQPRDQVPVSTAIYTLRQMDRKTSG